MDVALDAQLTQVPLLGLLAVTAGPDDRDPVGAQVREGVPVEPAQVGGDEGDVAETGRGGGEQVGEVDAPPPDGDAGQLVDDLDHAALPVVAEGGEDGGRHQSWLSGLPDSRASRIGVSAVSRVSSSGTRSLGTTMITDVRLPEPMTPLPRGREWTVARLMNSSYCGSSPAGAPSSPSSGVRP